MPWQAEISFIHQPFSKYHRALPGARQWESGGGEDRRTHPSGKYLSVLSVPPPTLLKKEIYMCKKKPKAAPASTSRRTPLTKGQAFPSRIGNKIKTASVGWPPCRLGLVHTGLPAHQLPGIDRYQVLSSQGEKQRQEHARWDTGLEAVTGEFRLLRHMASQGLTLHVSS